MIGYNPATGERIEFDDGRPVPVVKCFCPCCGYKTLTERGGDEICAICFWEDDGQGDEDADDVRGGSNGNLSLSRPRLNFKSYGACEESMIPNVRAPYDDEKRPDCSHA